MALLYYFFSAPDEGKSTAAVDQNISEDNGADKSCCASCGVEGVDNIKLKKCEDCDLVRYCSVKCQKEHRHKHKRACKKRSAELRDELLFKQPESSHIGDCPICCLPLSLDLGKSTLQPCCCTMICNGCQCANMIREVKSSLNPSCPFCRKAMIETKEERVKQMMRRIKANDPVALSHLAGEEFDEGHFRRAFEYYSKAAELGDVEAHYQLSLMYRDGDGVGKDRGKEMFHAEEAAIGGHPEARHNLGCYEWNNHNFERAVKHWVIAATQGYDRSVKELMHAFKGGFVNKEDLAAALRAHQAAVDATKSPQRKEAEEFRGRAEEFRREGLKYAHS